MINVTNKKKIIIQVIFVVILLLFVVGISYAAFTFLGGSTDNNTIGTGQISMSYQEPSSIVELNNALPASDDEGKEQNTYFEFTVTSYVRTNTTDNTGVDLPYEINISSQEIDPEYEQLSDEYVKVYLTKVDNGVETEVVEPILVSELSPSTIVDNNLVYETSNIFRNGRSQVVEVYRLRTWLAETFDSTQSTQYEYRFRVNVNSGNTSFRTPLQPTLEICFDYEGTTEITITNYKCYAGNSLSLPTVTEVVIPNEVNSLPVTKVNGNGFENKGIISLDFIPYNIEVLYNYAYTGNYQTFTALTDGYYEIESWGAQGGEVHNNIGGNGGYSRGVIHYQKGQQLYIYVGGKGADGFSYTGVGAGGYNGGGSGGSTNLGAAYGGSGGGGATDIRLVNGLWSDYISLESRIMVAAGGGGGAQWASGNLAFGGGLTGGNGKSYSGNIIAGGTQTTGYAFGQGRTGGNGAVGNLYGSDGNSGGGGGYYGGQAQTVIGPDLNSSGAGGSSFISGHAGCNAIDESSTSGNIIHTGQPNHYSGNVFTNTVMLAGNETQPNIAGTGTQIGNSGNGYAKIIYLGT